MGRVLESLHILVLLIAGMAFIYVSVHAATVLGELSQDLKASRLLQEQMLKDHIRQLKDHELQMQRR